MIKWKEERQEMNMNINEELQLYKKTVHFFSESARDYLYVLDLVNQRIYFSDKICDKYPLPLFGEEGIPLARWEAIVYPRDRRELQKDLKAIIKGIEDSHTMDYRITDREGNRVWVNGKGVVQKDEAGQPVFLAGSISELAVSQKTDSLTGLWNYDKYLEDMADCLTQCSGCLMVLGIDNFKSINVKNGRTFGNYILKTMTEVLENLAESPLHLYRLAGDCFAVNFPGTYREKALDFYNSVKREMEKYCTVSAGVASYHCKDEMDGGQVYQYAENALDRAKREGKNTLVFFSSDDYQKNLEQIALQDEMRASVRNNCSGFYLCYQPQIDSRDYSLYGAEALLRYESPSRGIVGPEEFIPLLEQSGMICQVGMWVLQTAVRQCREWREKIPEFHISVNISYVQLRQKGIKEAVLELLQQSDLPGEALTLEVTESMQLQDYSYFNKIFYEWKRYGIQISIDDFGTGYSSLSYLKSIEVDETKIDRCFISRIQHNAYNYRLLSNMIELAHSARIKVCCEGVETEEELLALRELKPDVLQGFLFARPYEKEDFERIYIFKETEEYQNREKREEKLLRLDFHTQGQVLENLRQEEIGTIAEGMDEIIYVSDVETYELYYMNAQGRKITGIYDYKGRKCYEVLQGKKEPCEFCTNGQLCKSKFHVWERENAFLGSRYILKDKLISWRGRKARLEMAINMEEWETLDYQRRAYLHEKGEFCRSERCRSCLSDSQYAEILENTSLGLWEIRLDPKTGKSEMYPDPVMRRIMGISKDITPEECYSHWYSRINPGYYHYINMAVENCISTGKIIQVEYTWNHPSKGEVMVRCMTIRAGDKDGMICLEGYHRIISELERPDFLPDGVKSELFEYNEKKHTIYFHTGRTILAGSEVREEDFPECWIRTQMVHPHFAGEFRELFRDVHKKEDLNSREMLFRGENGEYKWFKIKTRHLSSKAEDVYTIAVLMDLADEERSMELEYMRKTDFYEALLSETVAYAEVDVESEKIMQSGGLWEHYKVENQEFGYSFDEIIKRQAARAVCQEDQEKYQNYLSLQYIKDMYKNGIQTQKISFKRMMDGQKCWMKLVFHVFQDRYTENMYALMYMKNIDAEKRREMARERAARRDPLTNVYNRKVFENEVQDFMSSGEGKGALIILDLDNFKQVNDRFGHLTGDELLKSLAEILKSTFRSQDLIGRLGGDEFLVFVKDVTDKEILDRRMTQLFERLRGVNSVPLSCSAGISLAEGKDFDYKEELRKADQALYASKKKGKNQYSHYE
jgi:diguanylate cyclase (GGDEF)-like protein